MAKGKSSSRKAAAALLRALMPLATPKAIAYKPATRKSVTRTRTVSKPTARTSAVTRKPPAKRTPVTVLPRKPAARKAKRARQPTTRATGTWHSATYLGRAGMRPYRVYVPPGLRRTTAVPLVLLLHGCTQTPLEFAESTRFNQLANRHGFVVIYPQQTIVHNGQRCWQWYRPAHQSRARGEPAILAEITQQAVANRARWRIDPTRVYVAGISAGGAMALTLGAAYPDVFAAVGVHSAPPYRSATNTMRALPAMMGMVKPPPAPDRDPARSSMPPTIVFHGTADGVVNPVNGERVAQQWLGFNEASSTGPRDPDRVTRSRTATKRSSDGRKFGITGYYSARGRKVLEVWRVDGLGHAWSGGAKDASFSDPRGPRASTAMWRFFTSHSLAT